MKEILKFFKLRTAPASKRAKINVQQEQEALEKKAVEGAKKAVKEYRRVFDRLAEYDRT